MTREHLRVAQLLGLRAGIVAVTKADLLSHGAEPYVRRRIVAELETSGHVEDARKAQDLRVRSVQ